MVRCRADQSDIEYVDAVPTLALYILSTIIINNTKLPVRVFISARCFQ